MRLRFAVALPFVLLACSSNDEAAPAVDAQVEDTATPTDSGADASTDTSTDAATEAAPDAPGDATEDAPEDATEDAPSEAAVDSGADATVDDAGDAAGACHAVTFGAAAASITNVGSLPTMTGGTIPAPAVFDAVDVQTTGSTTGTYRATWSVRADGKIDSIEQLTLGSGTPPPAVPRTLTYSTAGSSLTRTRVCGGTESFTNQYRVRTAGASTFLEVRQDTVMFVFKQR